jgi:hypothetical protein
VTSDPTPRTPPLRRGDRDRGGKAVDRIKATGGCGACTHRVTAWGLAHCGLPTPREFPACIDTTPGFNPDHAVLYGKDATR